MSQPKPSPVVYDLAVLLVCPNCHGQVPMDDPYKLRLTLGGPADWLLHSIRTASVEHRHSCAFKAPDKPLVTLN